MPVCAVDDELAAQQVDGSVVLGKRDGLGGLDRAARRARGDLVVVDRATPWLFLPATWSPDTETATLWIWLPAMRSASVSAADAGGRLLDVATRPARMPRDSAGADAENLSPEAVRSPTSSVTFCVPTSSAARSVAS